MGGCLKDDKSPFGKAAYAYWLKHKRPHPDMPKPPPSKPKPLCPSTKSASDQELFNELSERGYVIVKRK